MIVLALNVVLFVPEIHRPVQEGRDISHRFSRKARSILVRMIPEETLRRYAMRLQEDAKLDRTYFLKKNPTLAQRADYNRRKERAEMTRRQLYGDLASTRPAEQNADAFQVRVNDKASSQNAFREAQRQLMHELNNHLSVILGRTEVLLNRFIADEQTSNELSDIARATQRVNDLIRKSQCNPGNNPT